LLALSGAWAIWDEAVTRRPWKAHQAEYAALIDAQVPERIRQIVVEPMGVVDRCTSCHLGVERPGLEDGEHPYRTHPRLNELLGTHPPERFGCTACHAGQGLALTAADAHGEGDPYWLEPILPKALMEARCGACHEGLSPLPGAPLLSEGRRLFRSRGCGGCHPLTGHQAPRIGPSLALAGDKLNAGWIGQWLRAPHEVRDGTIMPSFWPPNDPDAVARADQEITDLTAYLMDARTPVEPEAPEAGDPESGRKLFDSVGCRGCHMMGPADADRLLRIGAEEDTEAKPVNAPPVDFGPQLGDIATRTTAAWIVRWLADPKAWWSEATMPRFDLSPKERADLASFLMSASDVGPPPPLSAGSAETGGRLAIVYGCGGCHELPGKAPPIRVGPELDGFADKDVTLFDFGPSPPPLHERTRDRFTQMKLTRPRAASRPDIRLVMPDARLEPGEVAAMQVFLHSLDLRRIPEAFRATLSPEEALVAAGETLFKQRNCRGCHERDGLGGDIGSIFSEPATAPPTLTGLGKKLQPGWLFRFLRRPQKLRPWLTARMPDFGLDPDQAKTLTRMLLGRTAHDAAYGDYLPPQQTTEQVVMARDLLRMLRCRKCHGRNAKKGLSMGDYAPDMALTRQRLLPSWVRAFVTDPQAVIKNTRMPTFFPDGQTPLPELLGGSADAQIKLLTDYLCSPAFMAEEATR